MDIQQALYPNITLFIQAFVFFIFLMIIRQILTKPYSEVIEEREKTIRKNYEEINKLQEEANRFFSLAREELEKASRASKEILEDAKKEVEKIKAEKIAKAEEEVQKDIERGVGEIKEKLKLEKTKLEEKIGEVARDIVQRIEEEAA